jgi:hypothetical protein
MTSPVMETHLSEETLLQGLDPIRESPQDRGVLEMIVIRPKENERLVLPECALSAQFGMHGDRWRLGSWKSSQDGSPNPDVQIALMNSRIISLVAQEEARWPLAGDNLYVDLDLSRENLVCGQRLSLGSAILEITDVPHNGCKKFSERFGPDAMKFVNSIVGKQLRLRGVYAKVIQDGVIRVGDRIQKV